MAGKKIKLEEKAIREILVADTHSGSGAELETLKNILRKKRNSNDRSKPQQKSNHRLQQVADYQIGDHLKEGTQIFILLLVQQKV
jgi:predicted RNA-binding protein